MNAVDVLGDPVRRRTLELLADGGAGADPEAARAAAPATIAACAGTSQA